MYLLVKANRKLLKLVVQFLNQKSKLCRFIVEQNFLMEEDFFGEIANLVFDFELIQ